MQPDQDIEFQQRRAQMIARVCHPRRRRCGCWGCSMTANTKIEWADGGICLDRNGRQLHNGADMMHARDDSLFPVTIMHRVGKKAAGRLLDGREWNEVPS